MYVWFEMHRIYCCILNWLKTIIVFFVFDKLDAERFRKAGVSNILYQPLAVDKYAIQK